MEGVLDALPCGVAVLDRAGRVVQVNRAWEEFARGGRSDSGVSWTGRSYQEYWQALPGHPDDRASEVREGVASVLEGRDEQISCEVSCHGPGGEERWLRVRVSEFRHEGERGALVVHSDITEERRAREEARGREALFEESATRLRLATAATRVALWDWDLRADQLHFSPEWKAQLGYEDHELENRFEEWETRLHPDERAEILERVDDYLKGRRPDYATEFRLRHRDGSYRWIYTRADKQLDAEGNPLRLFGCHVDITEGREARLALERSEERYRTLFEKSLNGIIIADTETRRFTDANPAAAAMLGYTVEELCGLGVDEIHPPESLELVHREFEAQLKGEKGTAFGLPCLRKDGSTIYADVSGGSFVTSEGTFSMGFFTEVTERIRAESALRENEEKFRSLMQQSPVSIQIHDLEGRLMQSNAAYAALFGLNDEILAELYSKYSVREDEQARRLGMMPFIERVYAGEDVVFPPYEYDSADTLKTLDISKRDSRKCFIQTRGFPLRDERGEVVAAVFVSEDITERKQAEERLRTYQQQLQALSSQLSIVEERERQRIATELHDEVGQNLALARLQLASALKSTDDPGLTGKLTELSGTILQATRDTRQLVYDLSSPSLHELGLEEAITDFLEEGIGQRHGLETCFETDGADCAVGRDIKALLFRSVRELLTNVVKHAKAGRVTVRMEREEDIGRITIEDDGCGFAADPETFRASPEGGFGLFSIRERMANMGGTLEIESEPGGGCRAMLTVPCLEPDAGTEQGPNHKQP